MSKTKFAIGCLVQWYEVEMVSEYIETLNDAINEYDSNVLVDVTLVMNQDLEKTSLGRLEFLNIKDKCCSNNHTVCLKCFIKNSHSQNREGINLSCSFCREEGIYMTPQLLGDLIKYINKLEKL